MPRGRKTSRSGIITRSTGGGGGGVLVAENHSACDRVTRNSPRKGDASRTPPPPPLGRRVHPASHAHSPSPTTPPKLKKTPQKRLSPLRPPAAPAVPLSPSPPIAAAPATVIHPAPSKITDYFSKDSTPTRRPLPAAAASPAAGDLHDHYDEEVEEDEIIYATPEELDEDDDDDDEEDCSHCEDSGSGKENEDWRALSPQHPRLSQPTDEAGDSAAIAVAAAAATASGNQLMGGKVKDQVVPVSVSNAPGAAAAAASAAGSPLQPRRVVTRSHTAKTVPTKLEDLSGNASSLVVAATTFASNKPPPHQQTPPVSPLYSLSNHHFPPTGSASSPTRRSLKTPPQSPPTPHKIKLLEERTRNHSAACGGGGVGSEPASGGGNTLASQRSPQTAKKVISFSPKKELESSTVVAPVGAVKLEDAAAAAAAEDQLQQQQQQASNCLPPPPRCRRDLTRLLEPSSDSSSGPKNRLADKLSAKLVVGVKSEPKVNGTSAAAVTVSAVSTAASTVKSKVTDFFPIRRSGRKPKTELKAKQQSEIEAWLEKTGDDCQLKQETVMQDDLSLGIGIHWYEGKGRGIEAKKHFKKGDFVVEYAGDLMEGAAAAKLREEKYAADAATGCYMYYFRHGDKQYCIDATAESGRLGRLVNHSRLTPNCQTKVVLVKDIPRLILVAKTDIEPGTELLYDYGDRSKESLKAHPWLAL